MTFNKKMTDAAAAVLAGARRRTRSRKPLLRDWSYTILWNGSLALAGAVEYSPDFADREAIVTSPLVFLDQSRGHSPAPVRAGYRLGACAPPGRRTRGAFNPDPVAVEPSCGAQLTLRVAAHPCSRRTGNGPSLHRPTRISGTGRVIVILSSPLRLCQEMDSLILRRMQEAIDARR